MKTASIFILEKGKHWGGLIRRELEPLVTASDTKQWHWKITEVRATAQVEASLAEHPYAIGLIEVRTANLTMAYAEAMDLQQRFRHVKLIALADEGLAWSFPYLREAWACDVFTSSLDLARFLPTVKRFLKTIPTVEQTWQQQLEQMLPWPAYRP
ncbi:MAG: hypothetical protein ACO1RA_00705 [Planctomycetaceae bacterium]